MPFEKPENPSNDSEVIEVEFAQIEAARKNMAHAMANAAHNWRQSGTLISCTSCPFAHGFSVAPGIQLTGIEDGKPVLTKAW